MTLRPPISQDDWPRLVHDALQGDDAAWRTIVDHLSGVVWKVLHTYSLEPADREEAFASTFFRLYQKLDTVRDPSRLPGWIATAARNEANALWRARQRTMPVAELPLRELALGAIDDHLLDRELLGAVLDAFATLPPEAQALLRLLTTVPPLSYDEIAQQLDMPKGSIGPTAGRHLRKLRLRLAAYTSGGTA